MYASILPWYHSGLAWEAQFAYKNKDSSTKKSIAAQYYVSLSFREAERENVTASIFITMQIVTKSKKTEKSRSRKVLTLCIPVHNNHS